MSKMLVVSFSAILLLTSCASSDNKNAYRGTAIGAVAGGAVGALIGKEKGAIIGAGIGGWPEHMVEVVWINKQRN